MKLKADGIHLTSSQLDEIKLAKKNDLFTVVSTHSLKEAKYAQKQGADAITYSPIFTTPNKGEPKGIGELQYVVKNLDVSVIALGGIVGKYQLKQLQKVKKLFGFASIRFFV